MPTEVVNMIFQLCLIPLLAALTRYIIKFINIKADQICTDVDDVLAIKYTRMIEKTISDCVIATNQTYVDSLKNKGEFGSEAQKEAFQKTFDAVLAILSEDAKDYIAETTGDINKYLTQKIEATVKSEK